MSTSKPASKSPSKNKLKELATSVANVVRETASDAASVVREAGREVRKNFTAEYVHSTVENVVDDLEARYPESKKGLAKLGLARTLLGRIFGKQYVNNEWGFIGDLISGVVAIRK